MKNIKTFHDEKVKSIAQELSEKGYEVTIEPSKTRLPFDLDGYIPDLIATKNDQGIIVEVKSDLRRLSVDKFQDLAERVASHQGWRFILVPIENTNEQIFCDIPNNFPSWKELKNQLSNVNILIEQSQFLPALLFLWSILEASIRKRAIEQNLPIENFSSINLLNHAFSSGEISVSQFDLCNEIFFLRKKIAHGLILSMNSSEIEILKITNNLVNNLVTKWYIGNKLTFNSMFKILLDELKSIVQNEITDNLENYFHNNIHISPKFKSKWLIYSDYSMDKNSHKPNHVITYVIIPYAFENELDKLIGEELPKDLKDIQSVKPYFSKLLHSGLIFSISFVLETERFILGKDQNEKENNAKNWLKEIEESIPEKDEYKEIRERIKQVRQKPKINNYPLLEDIFLLSFLSAYVAFLIKQNCSEANIIGWLSDRDNKLTYLNEHNICHDLFYLFYIFICNYSHVTIDQSETIACADPSNAMWYDNLNRIADFITGSFADLKLNETYPIDSKFTTIMFEAIAQNKFVRAIKLYLGKDNIQVVPIEVNKNI